MSLYVGNSLLRCSIADRPAGSWVFSGRPGLHDVIGKHIGILSGWRERGSCSWFHPTLNGRGG